MCSLSFYPIQTAQRNLALDVSEGLVKDGYLNIKHNLQSAKEVRLTYLLCTYVVLSYSTYVCISPNTLFIKLLVAIYLSRIISLSE